jgi:hypothetical protein
VREDSLHTHVEELSARFAPRDFAHPENLARAAEYLARELGASTREQRFQVEGSAYTNLIASFGPDTPERIVVGAHYDTAGDQPGADDNASGVAGVLDLARLLAANPPAIRTELALWTLEEPPNFRTRHMGSAVHAAQLAAEKARVRLMISVEMIGYFSDAEGSQKLPTGLGLFYPSTGHFIAVVVGLLTGSEIDVVIVQDGVGTNQREGKVKEKAGPYLVQLARAIRQAGAHPWVGIEIFATSSAAGPGRDAPRLPAPGSRVAEQLEVAAPLFERSVMFDFFHYMSPLRGEPQAALQRWFAAQPGVK